MPLIIPLDLAVDDTLVNQSPPHDLLQQAQKLVSLALAEQEGKDNG